MDIAYALKHFFSPFSLSPLLCLTTIHLEQKNVSPKNNVVRKTNTAEQCLSLEQNDYSQNDFFAICSIQDPFIKILRKDFCCGVMSIISKTNYSCTYTYPSISLSLHPIPLSLLYISTCSLPYSRNPDFFFLNN